MITADCDAIRDQLDAFVDGELRGADLRHVSQHLDNCSLCADDVESRRALGTRIREAVAGEYLAQVPAGLCGGVVARARAESYFSLRSGLARAVEDWHWVWVGGGAVTATFLTMLVCSAILFKGPGSRPDADSLSALGTNLRTSSGALYAEVSRPGVGQEVMLVQVDTGGELITAYPSVLYRADEERLLVDALGEVLARHGALELASMPQADRTYAEWLLAKLARVRRVGPTVGPLSALTVHRLHLVTNTDVTAKGLD